MLVVYTAPGCSSCLKAKKWLDRYGIPFKEHNIFTQPPTTEEIREILALTENGTEEIISKRSKGYKKIKDIIDGVSLNDLSDMITTDPHILRRPIIKDEHRLQVGYNEEDIRKFLPRNIRQRELYRVIDESRMLYDRKMLEKF